MAVVFGEITEAFVRVEEQVFVPGIRVVSGGNLAYLKADHFVLRVARFCRASQEGRWAGFASCPGTSGGFELRASTRPAPSGTAGKPRSACGRIRGAAPGHRNWGRRSIWLERPASGPALEFTQVFQMQIVELDRAAEKQQRRILAVVDGRKFTARRSEIGEQQIGFVPILERQFALARLCSGPW